MRATQSDYPTAPSLTELDHGTRTQLLAMALLVTAVPGTLLAVSYPLAAGTAALGLAATAGAVLGVRRLSRTVGDDGCSSAADHPGTATCGCA